jgi:hypothetical protein
VRAPRRATRPRPLPLAARRRCLRNAPAVHTQAPIRAPRARPPDRASLSPAARSPHCAFRPSRLCPSTHFPSAPPWLAALLPTLFPDNAYLLKLLAALRQWHVITTVPLQDASPPASASPAAALACEDDAAGGAGGAALTRLLEMLRAAERFYDVVGGVAGYQLTALELMQDSEVARLEKAASAAAAATSSPLGSRGGEGEGSDSGGAACAVVPHAVRPPGAEQRLQAPDDCTFHVPAGHDLTNDEAFAARAAADGLAAMGTLAELYPLGGAGDRLGLADEVTGEPLPAALLPYGGRSLLAALLRDLAAREYLHYRVFGTQVTTPVAMMTSAAKGNHVRVLRLCEREGWFGRGRGGFRLFKQPLVPVVGVASGRWLLEGPGALALKPGGHGVIWKLARDAGVLDWLAARGASAALVRQISNPLAGTDTTLLALAGVGASSRRAFGFASCERAVGASEGVNVLLERRVPRKSAQHANGAAGAAASASASGAADAAPQLYDYEYNVSNLEYTEFDRLGIEDVPRELGGATSAFPANTNVLYVSLDAIRAALGAGRAGALPGMLVNLTKPSAAFGEAAPVRGGRLECSMQNIADVMAQRFEGPAPLPVERWGALSTFVVYASRRRVTSSAKRRRAPGDKRLAQTPEGSFLDLLRNGRDILRAGGVEAPEVGSSDAYLAAGRPPFLFRHHPALGPLWAVAAQKLRGGALAADSELELELAEADVEGLRLDGSLLITATQPLGPSRAQGAACDAVTRYCAARVGRARLRDVTVTNAGVDWQAGSNVFWAAKISRRESVCVDIQGDGEFDAQGVHLRGAHAFTVPPGHVLTLRPDAAAPEGWRAVLAPLAVDAATGARVPSWAWRHTLAADGSIRLDRSLPPHGEWLAPQPQQDGDAGCFDYTI